MPKFSDIAGSSTQTVPGVPRRRTALVDSHVPFQKGVGSTTSTVGVPTPILPAEETPAYSPFNIVGLAYSWRADLGVAVTGSDIDTYTDQTSGIVGQGSVSNTPTLNESSADFGGQAAVENIIATGSIIRAEDANIQNVFGGTNAWTIMGVSDYGTNNSRTIFTWGNAPSGATRYGSVYGAGTPEIYSIYRNSDTGQNATFSSLVVRKDGPQAFAVSYDGTGNFRFFADGVFEDKADTHRTFTGLDAIGLGNYVVGSGTTPIKAHAEFFVASQQLTDEVILEWYDYAVARYSLPT